MFDLLKPLAEGLEVKYASSSTPRARSDSKHGVVEEQGMAEKLPSVVTNAERDTLARDTKNRKGIIGSQLRGNHNLFTHYPEDPKL